MNKVRLKISIYKSAFMILFIATLISFQNCSMQNGLALKVVPGSGIKSQVSSIYTTYDLDEDIENFNIEINFESDMEGLTNEAFYLENASISNITGSGKSYSALITPKQNGIVKIILLKDTVKKINSNIYNAESNIFTRRVGKNSAVVRLFNDQIKNSISDEFKLSITFSRPYMFIDLGLMKVKNAVLKNLTLKSDSSCLCEYEVTVVPSGILGSTISVQFPENVFFNKWNSGNEPSNLYEILFQSTAPEILITSNAPNEVYGDFEIQLLSTIPLYFISNDGLNTLTNSVNDSWFNIESGKYHSYKTVNDPSGNLDPFKLIVKISPDASLLKANVKVNVIANSLFNKWNLGNAKSNIIERTYSNSVLSISSPLPLPVITNSNISKYDVTGKCPFLNQTVFVYFNNKSSKVGQSNCIYDAATTSGTFGMSLNFSSIEEVNHVGTYKLILASNDNITGGEISREYNISVALNLDIDVNTQTILFNDTISSQTNFRESSNFVIISSGSLSGLNNYPISVSSTDGNPKFKILRANGDTSDNNQELSSAILKNGDAVQLIANSPEVHAGIRIVKVIINGIEYSWTIKTIKKDIYSLVFVTSTSYAGNSFNGSLTVADKYCTDMVRKIGIGGSWKAIMGSTTESAKSRIPWAWSSLIRFDGAEVAKSINDLFDNSIGNPINKDENNNDYNGGVWTGVLNSAGEMTTLDSDTCYNWTSHYTIGGRYGLSSSVDGSWISSLNSYCYSPNHLYCMLDTSSTLNEDPKDFVFKDYVTTVANEEITNGTYIIQGVAKPIEVSISSVSGFPKLSVNGGNRVVSAIVKNGDAIRFHINSPLNSGEEFISDIKIGMDNYKWKVRTTSVDKTSRIFVTSKNDFSRVLGPLGLYSADVTCNSLATAAGLGSTWKAMVSDVNTNLRDRIPWDWTKLVLVDGTTVVANSWTQLWSGELNHGINLNEKGEDLSSDPYLSVMTGTNIDGLKANTCYLWDNPDNSMKSVNLGVLGQKNGSWINSGSPTQCWDITAQIHPRIYCIEDN